MQSHNEYKHQISCGNFIAETKKYVYLNDIAIDSLNPRYDLHNNNGGHVKDTICEMEHDSNLKFNTCKLKKKKQRANKYNLVKHKKNQSKKG
jgi:hypothetical protein